MIVRRAEARDLEIVCEIYNEGIAGRQATFETRFRTPAELKTWLDAGDPLLVAEDDDGQVVGFARVNPASDRPVYRTVGDYGVYVTAAARGRGTGRALMSQIVAEAADAGYHKLMSRIFTTNAASLALARGAGFREVGVQHRHARLDGAWQDCVLVERLLD